MRKVLVAVGILALSIGAAMSPAAVAKKAKPKLPQTQTFGAITAQQWPVIFQLTSDRRLITKMVIVLDEKCTSGNTLSGIGSGDKAINVSAAGAFRDTFSFGPITAPDGKTIQGSDQISGKLNKKRTAIKGTWRETVTINDPTAGTTDTCDSSAVAFTAVD